MSDNKKKENTEEITLTIDEEKMRAIKIYGKDKHLSVIDELHNAFESLYVKTVPQSVRAYIAMKQQMSSSNSDNHPPSDEGDGS
jgi:hypothetical protein